MTQKEAIEWMTAVDGQLYKSSLVENKPESWVAVVHTPQNGTEKAKLIIALGQTLQDAATAAESQWREQWSRLSGTH